MTIVEKQVVINAPVEKVWAALTDPQAIRAWMGEGSPVKVDLREGGGYRFFGGGTTGTFTRISEPTALEYTWRQGEWPAEWPDSLVRWTLAGAGSATTVRLTHTNFPNAEERDGHDEGWDLYFLGPMQAWLEGSGQAG